MQTANTRYKEYVVITVALIATLTFIPGYSQVGTLVTQEELINCVPSQQQPEDGISQNTLKKGHIVKTIHAEKLVFECDVDQGNVAVMVDVTIYQEVFENITEKEVLKTDAFVVTCIKHTAIVDFKNCFAYEPTDTEIIENCSPLFVAHPQEMNTVTKGNKVKSIETQKERFFCDMGDPFDKWVDLLLWTDIYEDLSFVNVPDSGTVSDIIVFTSRCVILLENALVEECTFTAPQNITP